nr:hypothetical protein Iba_chr15dCG7750 [Ipomoea batatas]
MLFSLSLVYAINLEPLQHQQPPHTLPLPFSLLHSDAKHRRRHTTTPAAKPPTGHHPTRTDHVPFPLRFSRKSPLISFATLHDSRCNAPPPKSLLPRTPPPSFVGFHLANQA